MRFLTTGCLAVIFLFAVARPVAAADWPRFRGPNGSATSADTGVPLTWSDSKNLKWKTRLPGPGSSSPIVLGKRVFVTCYSGYGLDSRDPGNPEDLRRHLICIDRKDGKTVWSKAVPAVLPEDPYQGYLTQHGYASSTPATDGERVYVFFGKSGALAFDLDGRQLWQVSVGTGSSNRRWGSGPSPVLYKNWVIVNASEESRSIRALKKETGEQVWTAPADGLQLSYGTPLLMPLDDGRKELVIAVPYEVWALNPDTGKLIWHAETDLDGNVAPSPAAGDGIVHVTGGFRRTGSAAIRAGGKGDVTKTHVLWSSSEGSYVPSPLVHDGHLYWVSDQGVACCFEAGTGSVLYRERLGQRGRGGFGEKPFYASVVRVGGRLYAVSRRNGTFVLSAKPEFERLALNTFESDESDFNATPAVSDGQVFLRSNRFLYCVAESD